MPPARAAVLNAVREPLSVDPLDVRGPRDGEVLVRIAAAGVCHSDLHAKGDHVVLNWVPYCGEKGEVARGVITF